MPLSSVLMFCFHFGCDSDINPMSYKRLCLVQTIVYLAPGIEVVVRLWWVDFREQEASLRASVLRVDVARHGEARLQDLLGVIQWSLQQLFEVLILGHFLVARLSPLGYGLEIKKGQWRWNVARVTKCRWTEWCPAGSLNGRMSHLSVVDHQLEESVHQQDAIWEDTAAVQENRLWTTDTVRPRFSSNADNSAVEGVRLTSGGP